MISVLIPARNEADRIAQTLEGVRRALARLAPYPCEILVIDDGSADDTARIARETGLGRVIPLKPGRGKGGALNAGLASSAGEIVVTLDADLGLSAEEMVHLVEPVLLGQADATIAALPAAGRSGGFGLAVRLARWAIRRATGKEIAVPLSGQRAIRREVLSAIGPFADGFGAETALTLELLRRGYRVLVVPTTMEHRALGRTAKGFLHRGKQLLHIAQVIWRQRAWCRRQ